MGGDERKIDVARFLDGLAAVHGFEDGELAGFFLDEPRDAVEIFPALAARHFSPDRIVGATRRSYGKIDIVRVGLGDLGQFLFRGRIDGVEIFSGAGCDEFAVDEKRIAFSDLDVVARFRRGRVIPLRSKIQPPVFRGEGVAAMVDAAVARQDNQFGRASFFPRHERQVNQPGPVFGPKKPWPFAGGLFRSFQRGGVGENKTPGGPPPGGAAYQTYQNRFRSRDPAREQGDRVELWKRGQCLLAGDRNVSGIDTTAGVNVIAEVRGGNGRESLLPHQRNVAGVNPPAGVNVAHEHAHGAGHRSGGVAGAIRNAGQSNDDFWTLVTPVTLTT